MGKCVYTRCTHLYLNLIFSKLSAISTQCGYCAIKLKIDDKFAHVIAWISHILVVVCFNDWDQYSKFNILIGRQAMTISFMGNKGDYNPSGGICNEYRLTDISCFTEVLQFYQQQQKESLGHHILFILDDFSQAYYTSSHAINYYGLDNTDDLDISRLPEECFEDGEHIGYLSTLEEFFIQQYRFEQLVKDITFKDACDKGITILEEDFEEWLSLLQDPISNFDNPISALSVPVKMCYETIYAFPNGYFGDDLSPAENYIVAKRFEEYYGFNLIGIGATYLGFIKTKPLSNEQKKSFYDDLYALYNVTDGIKENFEKIFESILATQDVFFIRYIY